MEAGRATGKFGFSRLCRARADPDIHRGVNGEEIMDVDINFTNARRRSNSSNYGPGAWIVKTKFEENETEPVFEEDLHGPEASGSEDASRSHAESSESVVSNDDDESAKRI
jgi:hypothetical protein